MKRPEKRLNPDLGWRSSKERRNAGTVLRLLAMSIVALPAPGAAQSAVTFNHTRFDGLLQAHVTEAGLVDYDAFAASPDFSVYLEALAAADVTSLPRMEQLALWINAYNAYTIALINEHGERRSIRAVNKTLGPFGGKGPWKEPLARVGGRTYTLDELQHEVIRKSFREPRIHFALVCGALGCPPLRGEAYTGEDLERQLQDQARRFLSDVSKNRGDLASRSAYLSPIFEWYRGDFPAGAGRFGRYLAGFLEDGVLRALLESGDFRVRYTDYDWDLNIRPSQSVSERRSAVSALGR